MTSPASIKPDLKEAPQPSADRERIMQFDRPDHAPADDQHRSAHGEPRRSLAMRMMRGFLQVLLPVAVIAAGLGTHQYLKATKPETPTRKARPAVFAISTVPVRFGNVQPQLRLYGNTIAGRQVEIRSLVAGQVVSTNDGVRDGGRIDKDEAILTIDPFNFRADLQETRAQAAEAAARIREFEASLAVERGNLKYAREQQQLAETDLQRAEPLAKRGAVTERTVDDRRLILNQRRQAVAQSENNIAVWQARIAQQKAALDRLKTAEQRAEQRLAETRLVAPFNAYVTDVGAQVGRMVGVNDRVATLIDRDWIEVIFTVTDRQFGRLVKGADGIEGRKVQVRWNVGETPLVYDAVIDRIGANVTSTAGGVQLYARIANPAAGVGLRPGAFVEVMVPDNEFSDVARLPSTAVFDGDTVYAIKDGKLEARKVAIVSTADSDVLVRGDLVEGEKIMTTRLSLPGAGVRVREVARHGG